MTPDDITELFGARCAEFDPDCACCRVWQQQDEIERLQRNSHGAMMAADELMRRVAAGRMDVRKVVEV